MNYYDGRQGRAGLPHHLERQTISSSDPRNVRATATTPTVASTGPGSANGLSFAQRLYASSISQTSDADSPTSPPTTVPSSMANLESESHSVESNVRRPLSVAEPMPVSSPSHSPPPVRSAVSLYNRPMIHSDLPVAPAVFSFEPTHHSGSPDPSAAALFYRDGIISHNTRPRLTRVQGARMNESHSSRPPSVQTSSAAIIQPHSAPAHQGSFPADIPQRSQSYQPVPIHVSSRPEPVHSHSASPVPAVVHQHGPSYTYSPPPPVVAQSSAQPSPTAYQVSPSHGPSTSAYVSPQIHRPSLPTAYPSPPLSEQVPPHLPPTYGPMASQAHGDWAPDASQQASTGRGRGLGRNIAMGVVGAGVGLLGAAALNNALGGSEDMSSLVAGVTNLMGNNSFGDSDGGGLLDQFSNVAGGDDSGSGVLDAFGTDGGGTLNDFPPPPFADIPGPDDMPQYQDAFDTTQQYQDPQYDQFQQAQTQQDQGSHHDFGHLLHEAYQVAQHHYQTAEQAQQTQQQYQYPVQQIQAPQQQQSFSQQQPAASFHHTSNNHATAPTSASPDGSHIHQHHPHISTHNHVGSHLPNSMSPPSWNSPSHSTNPASVQYHGSPPVAQSPSSGSHPQAPYNGSHHQTPSTHHSHSNPISAQQIGKYVRGAIAVTSLGLRVASLANGNNNSMFNN